VSSTELISFFSSKMLACSSVRCWRSVMLEEPVESR
jgi:hypothetical protein